MVAALRIGRVVSLADPALLGISKWDADGDSVSVKGPLHVATITDALVLRRQLLGLVNNVDEQIVPVTWGADSTIDGYYRVRSAAVDMEGPSLATGRFEWSASLERVPNYAAPVLESVLIGTLRTNSASVTAAGPWHAIPSASPEYTQDDVADSDVRVSADGVLYFFALDTYSSTPRFHLPPASYYIGAATFETGTTLRTVVGLQCENKPTAWRLSNGLVRVTPAGDPGCLDIAHYDGTAWETAKTFRIRVNSSHVADEIASVSVLRNSPEEVVIRLDYFTDGGVTVGAVTVDLALRRGDRFVRGLIQSDVAYAWKVGRDPFEAGTVVTGGLRATSNDAGGNRFVLLTSKAHSTTGSLAEGGLYASSAVTAFDFGIGLEVGGSGSVDPDRVADLIDQYFAAQAEKQSVVGH